MKTRNMNNHKWSLLLCSAVLALFAASCDKGDDDRYKDTTYNERKVFILYSAGYNSLSSALRSDINDLINNTDLHTDDDDADAILIYTHSKSSGGVPYLIYPHKDKYGIDVIDTLVTYPEGTISSSAKTLNTVLSYVQENFPADKYGLLFSSHATGYLPAGYYSNSSTYESSYSAASKQSLQKRLTGIHRDPIAVAGTDYSDDPLVKSIGQDYYSSSETYEIDLEDFVDAIPMDLEFLAFDACFMGGVEVAYQLRNTTHWLIASPTEILSEGMDYTTLASYLMAHPDGDYEGFCENYYNYYNAQSGSYQSATISLIDCTQMDALASECSYLFTTYRDSLDTMDYNDVQRFYRNSYHWFYDLGDIVEHLGCTEAELADFNEALDACVTYKAATEYFISTSGSSGFSIDHFSGLSMMLPCNAGDYLKACYATLDWNEATSLVE